jgi:hypothetical protein
MTFTPFCCKLGCPISNTKSIYTMKRNLQMEVRNFLRASYDHYLGGVRYVKSDLHFKGWLFVDKAPST